MLNTTQGREPIKNDTRLSERQVSSKDYRSSSCMTVANARINPDRAIQSMLLEEARRFLEAIFNLLVNAIRAATYESLSTLCNIKHSYNLIIPLNPDKSTKIEPNRFSLFLRLAYKFCSVGARVLIHNASKKDIFTMLRWLDNLPCV
jgi:hypothetical protein